MEDISPEQLQSILANNKVLSPWMSARGYAIEFLTCQADLGTLWTLCEKLQSSGPQRLQPGSWKSSGFLRSRAAPGKKKATCQSLPPPYIRII